MAYDGRGLKLSPEAFADIMLGLFRESDKAFPRREIIDAVETEHRKRGGAGSNPVPAFKKAIKLPRVKDQVVSVPGYPGVYRFVQTGGTGKYPKNQRDAKQVLYEQQAGRCPGCDRTFNVTELQVDHIVPKAVGGPEVYHNWQLLCGSCNNRKGDRPWGEFLAQQRGAVLSSWSVQRP